MPGLGKALKVRLKIRAIRLRLRLNKVALCDGVGEIKDKLLLPDLRGRLRMKVRKPLFPLSTTDKLYLANGKRTDTVLPVRDVASGSPFDTPRIVRWRIASWLQMNSILGSSNSNLMGGEDSDL
jgi:hypothetical protein